MFLRGVTMKTNSIPLVSPIPLQAEIFPIPDEVLIHEFEATFKNETAHMPEVSLRYLLFLIFAKKSDDELIRFASQVRTDLNDQRFERDKQYCELSNLKPI